MVEKSTGHEKKGRFSIVIGRIGRKCRRKEKKRKTTPVSLIPARLFEPVGQMLIRGTLMEHRITTPVRGWALNEFLTGGCLH